MNLSTCGVSPSASLAKRCLLPDDSEIPRPCRQSQWHRPRAPALQAPQTERAPCAGYGYSGCRTVLYLLSPELDPRVLHPDAEPYTDVDIRGLHGLNALQSRAFCLHTDAPRASAAVRGAFSTPRPSPSPWWFCACSERFSPCRGFLSCRPSLIKLTQAVFQCVGCVQ